MTLYYGTILGLPTINKFRTVSVISMVKVSPAIELFKISMFKCNISGKNLVTGTWVSKSLNRWFL